MKAVIFLFAGQMLPTLAIARMTKELSDNAGCDIEDVHITQLDEESLGNILAKTGIEAIVVNKKPMRNKDLDPVEQALVYLGERFEPKSKTGAQFIIDVCKAVQGDFNNPELETALEIIATKQITKDHYNTKRKYGFTEPLISSLIQVYHTWYG